jgi:hypothetical protein
MFIYLIQPKTISNNEQIYKLSKYQIGKKNKILFSMYTTNINAETELLDLFTNKFGIQKNYGPKYFKGDYKHMIYLIVAYLNKLNIGINIDVADKKIDVDDKKIDVDDKKIGVNSYKKIDISVNVNLDEYKLNKIDICIDVNKSYLNTKVTEYNLSLDKKNLKRKR